MFRSQAEGLFRPELTAEDEKVEGSKGLRFTCKVSLEAPKTTMGFLRKRFGL